MTTANSLLSTSDCGRNGLLPYVAFGQQVVQRGIEPTGRKIGADQFGLRRAQSCILIPSLVVGRAAALQLQAQHIPTAASIGCTVWNKPDQLSASPSICVSNAPSRYALPRLTPCVHPTVGQPSCSFPPSRGSTCGLGSKLGAQLCSTR